MQVVPFEIKHLPELNSWVAQWNEKNKNFVPVPASFYPETGGFIVEGHCAAFIYLTNTAMAFYENIIVNPNSTYEERTESIKLVDQAIAEFAAKNNVKLMIGRSANDSLLQRGIDNGWSVSNKKYNMMYKNIGDKI